MTTQIPESVMDMDLELAVKISYAFPPSTHSQSLLPTFKQLPYASAIIAPFLLVRLTVQLQFPPYDDNSLLDCKSIEFRAFQGMVNHKPRGGVLCGARNGRCNEY